MMGQWWHKLLRGLQQQLALYGNLQLWRQVWRQSRRQGGGMVAAAIALLWLVSFLIISFLVLQLPSSNSTRVPVAILNLARHLATSLGVFQPSSLVMTVIPWPWLVLLIGVTGLCSVAGTTQLTQTLAGIYQGRSQARQTWLTQLWPWAVTALLLLEAPLLASWLRAPESSQLSLWAQAMGLLRWLAATGLITLTLALLNRFSTKPWVRGCPLWPGVGLTLGLGLGVWNLGDWLLALIRGHGLAYGLLLVFGLGMIRLVLLLWLVLWGAQFNVGLLMYGSKVRNKTGLYNPRQTPPPSFDSFKINR